MNINRYTNMNYVVLKVSIAHKHNKKEERNFVDVPIPKIKITIAELILIAQEKFDIGEELGYAVFAFGCGLERELVGNEAIFAGQSIVIVNEIVPMF